MMNLRNMELNCFQIYFNMINRLVVINILLLTFKYLMVSVSVMHELFLFLLMMPIYGVLINCTMCSNFVVLRNAILNMGETTVFIFDLIINLFGIVSSQNKILNIFIIFLCVNCTFFTSKICLSGYNNGGGYFFFNIQWHVILREIRNKTNSGLQDIRVSTP